MALRTRVSMSAMGSVMVMAVASSPAGLAHARDLARQRQRAETDAARAELPHEGVAAPAQVAARLAPRAELRRHLALGDPAGLAHVVWFLGSRASGALLLLLGFLLGHRAAEGHAQALQQIEPDLVPAGRRHDGDV